MSDHGSLVGAAPTALQPLVEFIEARLNERDPQDDALGVLLTNTLGLLVADTASIVPVNALRNEWAAEIMADLAYLWCDHPDYRPQWLPNPIMSR